MQENYHQIKVISGKRNILSKMTNLALNTITKILYRKKVRKYCWRRFNIIVYLPRLGFKSRNLFHSGVPANWRTTAWWKFCKIFAFQPKTIQYTVWQSILPRCAFIRWNICRRRKFSGVLSCASKKTKYLDCLNTLLIKEV